MLQKETTAVAGPPVLETRGVTKTYETGGETIHALRGVDFQVCEEDFIAIRGPSGSGKSTLLNVLSCIDRPSNGEVWVQGRRASDLSERALARLRLNSLGLVFQAFNLIPVLSAYENIEYPLLLQRVAAAERRRRVREWLDAVGLSDLARRRPPQMSGGQQQRVALARALVTEADVVLADEPTGNLDTETTERVLRVIERLNREHSVSFVVVTHDPEVSQFATRSVDLRDGQLIERSAG
jgi:putative ABC transport system ATP-binding protein